MQIETLVGLHGGREQLILKPSWCTPLPTSQKPSQVGSGETNENIFRTLFQISLPVFGHGFVDLWSCFKAGHNSKQVQKCHFPKPVFGTKYKTLKLVKLWLWFAQNTCVIAISGILKQKILKNPHNLFSCFPLSIYFWQQTSRLCAKSIVNPRPEKTPKLVFSPISKKISCVSQINTFCHTYPKRWKS